MSENKEGEIRPITHSVIAKSHTPVYKMHRYFARRPHNVFDYLIEHYSLKDEIILDPFCGGGVTVFEGLRFDRKVIGIDFNPMATFITRMQATSIDLYGFKDEFKIIEKSFKEEIEELYLTKCTKCNKLTPAEWYEWSRVGKCPSCGKDAILAEGEKVTFGTYLCPHCKSAKIKTADCDKEKATIVRIKFKCKHCGLSNIKKPDKKDYKKIREINDNFANLIKKKKLTYPKDKMPSDFDLRRPYNAMFNYFYDFFTKRNLYALSLLYDYILKIDKRKICEMFFLVFSSTLDYSSKMSRVVQGAGREATTPTYWVGALPAENNVWFSFEKRFKAAFKGKKYSNEEIGLRIKETKNFDNIKNSKDNCMILNQSSTNLKQLDDNSIDAIITDPPYGGNIMYSELSNFWAIWLKDVIKIDNLIDNKYEAIKNKQQNKKDDEYRELLYGILKECHRVLKQNRWLVMTFHNKELTVWNSLLLAAHDAGFALPEKNGVIYQPPIKAYVTTLHQKRSGAMLGDFILSFKKLETMPAEKLIDEKEIDLKIKDQVQEVIRYRGGANISTIYMQLMPFLTNEGLLHKVGQKDLEPYLKKHFEKRRDKWYLREHFDEKGKIKLLDFVPLEKRMEDLIRSILKDKKKATIDEIYENLYVNLVNGMTPETEEIMQVLHRIAQKTKTEKKDRDYWQLKAQTSLLEFPSFETEIGETTDDNLHNLVIKKIAQLGLDKNYDIHIGEKEQYLEEKFKKISIPMADNIRFGLTPEGLAIIKQIDILWIKNNVIVSAFEVEKSTTINSGIDRFRNLFVELPNLHINARIVIPDKRTKEAERKINSPANKKSGISNKISIMLFSDIL